MHAPRAPNFGNRVKPKILLLILFAAFELLTSAQAQQRMGIQPGPKTIAPRGSSTLGGRSLDEHERAPWTSDSYTHVLSDDPKDIMVKIGDAQPVALDVANAQGRVSITGYDDPGSRKSCTDEVRVKNLTDETIKIEVKRFTPIGTASHGALGYDVSRFEGLGQRELWAQQSRMAEDTRRKVRAEKRDAPYRAEADKMNKVEVAEVVTNSIGMRLRRIPAGKFMMGLPNSVESTRHEVTLTKDYFLGVTEVTQAEFEAVMGKNPSHFKGSKRPVESVSWDDAVEFCRKLSYKEFGSGRSYRLPTEAEWEYACRAGRETTYFWQWDPGVPKETLIDDYIWFDDNSGNETHDVGQKKPNRWGLFDMSGNVWEWCADWWGRYRSGAVTDPSGPESGSARVLRGGSWDSRAGSCVSTWHTRGTPGVSCDDLGFRIALSPVR